MSATPFVTAGAGFLLAVLWFDLMFDVQVLPYRDGTVPAAVLDSIAAYYRRVTTAGRPMNRMVALAMVGTIGATLVQIAERRAPRWAAWTSLVLVSVAVIVAAVRTVANAKRVGEQGDPLDVQGRIARSVLHDHVFCATLVVALLIVQLGFAS